MMADELPNLGTQPTAALKRYPLAAEELPAHGETWKRNEIGISQGALSTFSNSGVIQNQRQNCKDGNVWMTEQGIAEWVEERINLDLTPCGKATGIRTITAGEEYTCSDPECDCRMDRKTAEEVVA